MSRLEVEKYTCAGESISYHDTTLGNQGGSLFRVPDNADVWDDAAASHAHDIGGTTDGEWLVYTVEITATGTYDLWVAAAERFTLTAGTHQIRLAIPCGGANLDYFSLTPTSAVQSFLPVMLKP